VAEIASRAIVDAAMAGTLTEKSLTDVITEAAHRQLVASYAQELRARSERMFVEQFHRSLLKNGGVDAILDSLRPSFDKAAEAIAAAKDVIPTEAPAEEFLRTAQPPALALFSSSTDISPRPTRLAQSLPSSVRGSDGFPMVTEYANSDGFRLEDRAIWCADGDSLEAVSAVFRRPDQGHRTSPWFKLPLRLHSVTSAQARYDAWASGEWERLHAGPPTSLVDEKGRMRALPKPENPYAARALATD
jgi:hypothetical protein